MSRAVYYEGDRMGREIDRRFWHLASAMVNSAIEQGLVTPEEARQQLDYARTTDDMTELLAINGTLRAAQETEVAVS